MDPEGVGACNRAWMPFDFDYRFECHCSGHAIRYCPLPGIAAPRTVGML